MNLTICVNQLGDEFYYLFVCPVFPRY